MRIIFVLLVSMFLLRTAIANAEEIELVSKLAINWAGTDSTQKYVSDGGDGLTYFYDGYYNIFSIDVSDAVHPNQIGNINLGGSPGLERRIARSGDYLYVPRSGTGNPQMNIVDISNPANPTIVNSSSVKTVRNCIVEGNYLYTSGDGNINVFNISAPSSPSLVWSSPVPPTWNAFDIAVKNGYVYVAGEGLGKPLSIVDTNSQTIDSISLDAYSNRALINDDWLYVWGRNRHLDIFDITSLANPVLMSTYTTIGDPMAMTISGNNLFLAASGTLEGVDISNPLNPSQFSAYSGLDTWDIYARGKYIYASSNDGLQIFSVNNSVVPEPTSLLLFGIGGLVMAAIKRSKR